MIVFKCPNCNAPIKVSEEAAGKKGQCRSCGKAIQVPNRVGTSNQKSLDELPLVRVEQYHTESALSSGHHQPSRERESFDAAIGDKMQTAQSTQLSFSKTNNLLRFLSANCYDNAFMESCFGTIKTELEMTDYESIESARREIATYIAYYNNSRRHSSLEYLTPTEFELNMRATK